MDSIPARRSFAKVFFLLACISLSRAAWADDVADTSTADPSALGRAIVSRPTVIEAPDGLNTVSTDVNDDGVVVGQHFSGAFGRAFRWSRAQGFQPLETSEDAEMPYSTAYAINECGVIVGESSLPGIFGSRAVRWVRGEVEDLGTLGGDNSFAVDVNERGQVVGASWLDDFITLHAFLWTEEDGMIDLGTLGGDFSVADAINNRGEIVGSSTTATGEEHAFFWSRRTGMIDLGTRGEESSRAFALNDRSEVAMLAAGDFGNIARGFRWTRKRGFSELRPLVDWALPKDINHYGFVAGESLDANRMTRTATLWPHSRIVIAIEPRIGETDSGISALRQQYVAGSAFFNGGDSIRAVVWRLRLPVDRKHQRELERLCRKGK